MIVYQGLQKSCVACSLAWISMFYQPSKVREWQELFIACGGSDAGLEPVQTICKAKAMGWIKWYFRIPSLLVRFFTGLGYPIAIGIPMNRLYWSGTSWNHPVQWNGINDEDHMVVCIGHDEFGNYRVVGWGDETKQEERLISKNYPIKQAYLCR